MRRRDLAVGVVAAAWAAQLGMLRPATAQQGAKTYRLGYLSGGTAESRTAWLASLRQGLGAFGYVEGRNLVIETRFAEGRFDRLPALVADLLAFRLDALLVSTTPAALAAHATRTTVPIVLVGVSDPIGVGLVSSLSRPGGNITGLSNITTELAGKRLEILKELVPSATRIAVLINPDDQNAAQQMDNAVRAAAGLRVVLEPVLHIRARNDLDDAFQRAADAQVGGAIRMVDPLVNALIAPTVELAAKHRIPVMHPFREAVVAGGLVSFSASQVELYRHSATFLHKIFNGAKPSDLPVELPTRFEMVINLKTAKALGLDVPPLVLARADEVIE
jgi:putative tryptophan/tyrosine transport system substrate-binding protein